MTTIRSAAAEDCPGLARVQVDSYRSAYAKFFPKSYFDHFSYEEQEQDWRDWLTSNINSTLLVAQAEAGQITGYVLAMAQPDIFPGYDSEIVALHVRQSHQSRGIGKALMKAAVKVLHKRGSQSAMLWTLKDNPVRAWYSRLGGKLIGEKQDQIEGWEIVEVAYGWESISPLIKKLG